MISLVSLTFYCATMIVVGSAIGENAEIPDQETLQISAFNNASKSANHSLVAKVSIKCRDNQWACNGTCIHKRSFCSATGTCHKSYSRPCGDGSRCYHRLDSCWEAACLNVNCQGKDVRKQNEPVSELDRTQAKFLLRCPEVNKRFDACPDRNYGYICFYPDEWACGSECIGKTDVCDLLKLPAETVNPLYKGISHNKGCDWGMKRCGGRCVDRHTTCNGTCWDESSRHQCGSNMCLSKYQLQDYHVCNGTCYDHTIPCNGKCQSSDFYMCASGDQCYRYWDHCDNDEHCDDGSDEGGTCRAREYIVYLVPMLMLLFIGSLVIILIIVKVKGCALRHMGLTTSNSGTACLNGNGVAGSQGLVRNQIAIPTGEMVMMTSIDTKNNAK